VEGLLMAPAPRLAIVTLGVADVAAARGFYERLGFVASGHSTDTIIFLETGGTVLGLFGRADLAADATVPDSPTGFAGVTLAWNLPSEAAVVQAMAHAVAVGARRVKAPEKVHWGGYSGYFADPDGHLWEVAYNPFVPLDANGQLMLGPAPPAEPTKEPS
jgi:catechol 2,3-dioxygenase-like lactoylglutathione lyase family enzyme